MCLRAVRGELLQQRGEFSLDLDHPPRFREISLQPRILVLQLRQLMLARINRWSTTHWAQPRQRSLIPLVAPFGDQRRVQAFTSKQRTFGVAAAALVLSQDPQLVHTRKHAPCRSFGNLRLDWLIHLLSMPPNQYVCHHHRSLILRPSNSVYLRTQSVSSSVDSAGSR